MPLPVHLQDMYFFVFSIPSRKKCIFVIPPPWMTTCALNITKPTSLFHIHLSDRKGAPFTMEMKHKHAEKTVHEVNRESLINLLQSNQQLHLDISTAPSTTHSNSTLACKQFSVRLPAQQGKI